MPKTLKDIVRNSTDLYFIRVEKPSGTSRHNRNTWKFIMMDPRWTDESFKSYKFKPVFLRRDNCFFMAYKSDESNAYFVDPKRAMFRTSVNKYVNSLVDYSVKTNDISITKNQPSFRITQNEMKKHGIDNFLDLCYEFRQYTAIGTGYTRDIRNLVVLDIDVDCTKPDNKAEINTILYMFARHNSLPDFYIFNKNTNHVQMQWLIKDLQYKEIDQETVDTVIKELYTDKTKNKEIDFRSTDFTRISKLGYEYRLFTYALCEISSKRKFGDKNYTFWKAKNPMAALIGEDNLELYMPYFSEGEIRFLTDEEKNILFSSKEERQRYMDEAPDIIEWYAKIADVMDPKVDKVSKKKVEKTEDADDVTEIKKEVKTSKKPKKEKQSYGESRNTFVIRCTRSTTWETAKRYGCRKKEDIDRLPHEVYNIFRNEVEASVRQQFNERNDEYGGVWPDTTNLSSFSPSEFRKAFNSAFSYATNNINNFSYSDEDREKSVTSRKTRKNIRLAVVDDIRTKKRTKTTRTELLKEVNRVLQKIRVRPISMGSLKRYIIESNKLTDEQRTELSYALNERKS